MTTTTTTTTTATEVFDAMMTDDRWHGFGYLGTRHNALDTTDPEAPAQPERVTIADEMAHQWADAHRWTAEQLFTWANSKDGRLYGDAMFGGPDDHHEAFAMAVRWGVLPRSRRR